MADKKDFEAIMTSITAGLSGDSKADIKYLQEQSEKYKDHEYGKEIVRACGRLMYQVLPDDKKEELGKGFGKIAMGFDAALDEIRFNIYEKRLDVALKLMEAMVQKYEEMGMYENDAVSEYYCFREPMEEILYCEYNEPKKDLRRSQVDYAEMYLLYGSLLIELNRIEDATEVLAKAKRWNPAYARLAFEHAESYKMRGMLDEFAKLTKETFKYAYYPKDLARCYRNMAFYLVEKKEYKAAVCCLLFANQFDKTDVGNSELYYISQEMGEVYNPTQGDLVNYFEENEIPYGPEEEIIKIAYSYGMHFYENDDLNTAAYFLSIAAAYVDDEELNKTLKDISQKMGNEE